MWLNRRSRSNGHARTRLGGSLTGCDGTRSILITILPLLTHSGVGGQNWSECQTRRPRLRGVAGGLPGRTARLPGYGFGLHQSDGDVPDGGRPVESGGGPGGGAVGRGGRGRGGEAEES